MSLRAIRRRLRLARTGTARVVVAAALAFAVACGGGGDDGTALHDDAGLAGAAAPVRPGEAMSFGLVRTWNQSKEPVELVEARLLHLDPDLELLGFTAREYREAPGSAREFPVPLSVPLDEFPVLPPADEEQFVILFGLRLRSGGVAGSALGVEVTYRQGGELRKQTFRAAAYICKADSVVSDCIDDDPMRTQEYDDLLSESARRGTGVGPAPT